MLAVILFIASAPISIVLQIALNRILVGGRFVHVSFIWSIFLAILIMGTLLTYYFASWLFKRDLRSISSDAKYPEANELLTTCAKNLDINPCPRLIVTKPPLSDCYLYGTSKDSMHFVIGEELITYLNKQQLKAVFVHELSHIKNGDAKFMTWFRFFAFSCRNMILTFLLLLVPIYLLCPPSPDDAFEIYRLSLFFGLSYLAIKSVSRVRELLADARTVIELGSDSDLLASIRRIAWYDLALGVLTWLTSKSKMAMKKSGQNRFFKGIASMIRLIAKYTVEEQPRVKTRLLDLKLKKHISTRTKFKPLSLEASFYAGLSVVFLYVGLYMATFPLVMDVPLFPVIAIIHPFLQLGILDMIPISVVSSMHLYHLDKYDWIYLSKKSQSFLRVIGQIISRVGFSCLGMAIGLFLLFLDFLAALSMFLTYTLVISVVVTLFIVIGVILSRLISWSVPSERVHA